MAETITQARGSPSTRPSRPPPGFDQGTKIPCRRKGELPGVDTWPSGPPSETRTSSISQIERIRLGHRAGQQAHPPVVFRAQVAPTVVLAVLLHGTVALNGRSAVVAESLVVGPLPLVRDPNPTVLTWTSPV